MLRIGSTLFKMCLFKIILFLSLYVTVNGLSVGNISKNVKGEKQQADNEHYSMSLSQQLHCKNEPWSVEVECLVPKRYPKPYFSFGEDGRNLDLLLQKPLPYADHHISSVALDPIIYGGVNVSCTAADSENPNYNLTTTISIISVSHPINPPRLTFNEWSFYGVDNVITNTSASERRPGPHDIECFIEGGNPPAQILYKRCSWYTLYVKTNDALNGSSSSTVVEPREETFFECHCTASLYHGCKWNDTTRVWFEFNEDFNSRSTTKDLAEPPSTETTITFLTTENVATHNSREQIYSTFIKNDNEATHDQTSVTKQTIENGSKRQYSTLSQSHSAPTTEILTETGRIEETTTAKVVKEVPKNDKDEAFRDPYFAVWEVVVIISGLVILSVLLAALVVIIAPKMRSMSTSRPPDDNLRGMSFTELATAVNAMTVSAQVYEKEVTIDE